MDIQKYQSDREQDLQTFKSEYDDLKALYINFLTQSIHDPSKVEQVLEVNKSLTDLVNQFISDSQTKFDTTTIQDLTNDIINYQKEYEEIKNSQKKSQTLKLILNKENEKLQSIQSEFSQYLWILFGCIVILIILIFIAPSTTLPQIQDLQLSTIH
jgi:predicted PurR-regulated permease PerM